MKGAVVLGMTSLVIIFAVFYKEGRCDEMFLRFYYFFVPGT